MADVKPGMIGVHGKTHLELEQFIDMQSFDKIQIELWKGMALAKPLAHRGQFSNPVLPENLSFSYKENKINPIFYAYDDYMALPNDSEIKVVGEELRKFDNTVFLEFLKYAFQAHDSIYLYYLWNTKKPGWKENTDPRQLDDLARFFPETVKWVDKLIEDKIFSFIGRAYIVSIESGGLSFEHFDEPADAASPEVSEFIHIRPDLIRPFYVYNPQTKTRHYIQTRVGWFNDKDVHGGDIVFNPSYSIRIDGIFTNEFRQKAIEANK